MKCDLCGTEFNGNFCPSCGAPASKTTNHSEFEKQSTQQPNYQYPPYQQFPYNQFPIKKQKTADKVMLWIVLGVFAINIIRLIIKILYTL